MTIVKSSFSPLPNNQFDLLKMNTINFSVTQSWTLNSLSKFGASLLRFSLSFQSISSFFGQHNFGACTAAAAATSQSKSNWRLKEWERMKDKHRVFLFHQKTASAATTAAKPIVHTLTDWASALITTHTGLLSISCRWCSTSLFPLSRSALKTAM